MCQPLEISSLSSVYIVPYEWNLKEMNQEPKTIATKLIMFRNTKSFRVGLQNRVVTETSKPTLFIIAFNLHKMGLRVREILYCSTKKNQSFQKMINKNNDYDGSLQLFTSDLNEMLLGNCTFNFLIYLDGNVSNYSHQPSDRLLKHQLWTTVGVEKHFSSDVKLVVQYQTFWAHKAVLAARSPVFAREFKKQDGRAGGVHQIKIEADVDDFEQFLRFVYTGESNKLYDSVELRELADRYQLPTLSSLCRVADKKIRAAQFICFGMNFYCDPLRLPRYVLDYPMQHPPENWNSNGDAFSEPTLTLNWKWKNSQDLKAFTRFQYLNEDVFSADISGDVVKLSVSNCYPTLRFICINTHKVGFKVSNVSYSIQRFEHDSPSTWIPMQRSSSSNENCNYCYSVPLDTVHPIEIFSFNFRVQISSFIDNFYYEMVDTTWARQLWSAATDRQLTDVVIWIGREKLEAHRVILSARSPILDVHIKSQIRWNGQEIKTAILLPEIYSKVAKPFLEFLYTGSLSVSANDNLLLSLAKRFEVETLITICQLASRSLPDKDN